MNLPFEIHITVQQVQDVENFKKVCNNLEVKPLLIDLQNKQGENIFFDLMTSSVHHGNDSSAYSYMKSISDDLFKFGFNVIREKIETVPWHPLAPTEKLPLILMPVNCYFECHISIIASSDRNNLSQLKDLLNNHHCHLSKNVFKKIDNDKIKIIATYRKYQGFIEKFNSDVAKIESEIKSNNFMVDKVITEFSIYDSKISHDISWINQ